MHGNGVSARTRTTYETTVAPRHSTVVLPQVHVVSFHEVVANEIPFCQTTQDTLCCFLLVVVIGGGGIGLGTWYTIATM